MIKASILYPYSDGCRFDLGYYCTRHMSMVRERLGEACHGIGVDHGISGETAKLPPRYVVMTHLFFDTVAAFQAAFAPHEAEIMNDTPNFTDIAPVVQISQVVINARRSETGPFHLHPEGGGASS